VKAVVQRVLRAEVSVDGECVGRTDAGLVILLGVLKGDGQRQAERLAERIAALRCFRDGEGRMNLSAVDLSHSALVISQFTLAADCRRGRRPSFERAAAPDLAEELYLRFVAHLRATGVPAQTGVFGAMMEVLLVNDGPVTLTIEEPAEAGSKP
jgi:D-tyrosyl-tRNA(Tyr) deacylase